MLRGKDSSKFYGLLLLLALDAVDHLLVALLAGLDGLGASLRGGVEGVAGGIDEAPGGVGGVPDLLGNRQGHSGEGATGVDLCERIAIGR